MMAEYSDQVRSVDHSCRCSAAPTSRLHLPKHYALASWVTARRPPADVHRPDAPVAVDPERIAWHHRRQHERGGRELESFRQPHWDREDDQTEDPHEQRRAGRGQRRRDASPWSRDSPLRPDR